MEQKTNPMRHLDRLGIAYTAHDYGDQPLGGMEVAQATGEDPREVFKTLVTESKEHRYYVFLVPVTGELDLKKAAASVGEKSLSMIRSKDLLGLTGYVHGGCSPLCLKRPMRVTIDATAEGLDRIYFSAGKVGQQIEMAVADLPKALDFQFADIRKPASE
ncbi:MAG: aminoacyl-tRNA deacylase [Thermoplasmata archaeon]|nr:aminoacyl-tRNA deacylase [Thermoplasmata archaeon]